MPEYSVPDNLRYSREHEWAKIEDDIVRVGITDYAAKALHDVVYVSLPEVGASFKQGGVAATVESIKSVSEVYCPVSGTVIEVNRTLKINPEKINQSPYVEGWLFRLKPTNLDNDIKKLLISKEYMDLLSSLKKL
jgi:glycine cleavage system H protein